MNDELRNPEDIKTEVQIAALKRENESLHRQLEGERVNRVIVVKAVEAKAYQPEQMRTHLEQRGELVYRDGEVWCGGRTVAQEFTAMKADPTSLNLFQDSDSAYRESRNKQPGAGPGVTTEEYLKMRSKNPERFGFKKPTG